MRLFSLLAVCFASWHFPVGRGDSVWSCVSTKTAVNTSSSFCRNVAIPQPGVCSDDGSFDDNQRSEHYYQKQRDQCQTLQKRQETCPNAPERCRDDVFNKSTFCGGHDQQCNPGRGRNTCLPFCYADCYPCNSKSDCDMLVSFGVSAAPDAPCFSLEGRSIPPSTFRKWKVRALKTGPPHLAAVLKSIDAAATSATRTQYPSGQAKCDYHLLHSEFYDYEQIWHTGQLCGGLLAYGRLQEDEAYIALARTAGDWWVSQAISAGPAAGIVASVDTREGGHGCITDACGPTEDLTDVSDGSKPLFELTQYTNDTRYADAASNSALWQLENMQVPGIPGLFFNVVNMSTGKPLQNSSTTTLDDVSRSNIEGSLFRDACFHLKATGRKEAGLKLCSAFLQQADYSIQRQDPVTGLWMMWTPNDASTNRFHPRFNVWYALSLLEAADLVSTDVIRKAKYVHGALLTARTMGKAQQSSGTIYYWNVIDDKTGSSVPIRNAACGSSVALSLKLWLRLYFDFGYESEFSEHIVRATLWLLANQYDKHHADPNLAGAYFELGFRKLARWDSMHELDVVQRDLATNIGLQALVELVERCRERFVSGICPVPK
jgi:rhamnogalacturonyl hydrolase YesR